MFTAHKADAKLIKFSDICKRKQIFLQNCQFFRKFCVFNSENGYSSIQNGIFLHTFSRSSAHLFAFSQKKQYLCTRVRQTALTDAARRHKAHGCLRSSKNRHYVRRFFEGRRKKSESKTENSRRKKIIFGSKGGLGSLLYDPENNALSRESEVSKANEK